MIFVAVGTQLPFDRLIHAVDDWAAAHPEEEVVAQAGKTAFTPQRVRALAYIPADEFADYSRRARLLVAHAGMGSILGALEMRKPLVIMPRLASLGEHRNDHQLATAQRFADTPGVHVANDAGELSALLDRSVELEVGAGISASASPELIGALRDFIGGRA